MDSKSILVGALTVGAIAAGIIWKMHNKISTLERENKGLLKTNAELLELHKQRMSFGLIPLIADTKQPNTDQIDEYIGRGWLSPSARENSSDET